MAADDNSMRNDAQALSTIGGWLSTFRGRIPAFDFMRFAAASAVIYAHSFAVAENRFHEEYVELLTNHVLNFGTLAVQFFFLISGFVVADSAARSASVRTYLLKRACRLVPGLLLVVVVTAFVMGPLFTELPLRSYFADDDLYSFFLNLAFITRGHLPGVFNDVPAGADVNVPLWSLRYEVLCYLALAAIARAHLLRPFPVASITATLLVGAATPVFADLAGLSEQALHTRFHLEYIVGESMKVVPFFFVGTLFYVLRKKIVLDRRILIIALSLGAIMIHLGYIYPICPFALGYLVFYVGFYDVEAFRPFRRNDYSYGLYIWGFPVQQCWIALLPNSGWALNLALSYPVALAFAAMSWHLVEKRWIDWGRRFESVTRAARPSVTMNIAR